MNKERDLVILNHKLDGFAIMDRKNLPEDATFIETRKLTNNIIDVYDE